MPLWKEFDFLAKNGILRLSDLVDNNVSWEHLNEKLECYVSVLPYNSLICSIPSQWKEQILNNKKPDKYKIYDIPHLAKKYKQSDC